MSSISPQAPRLSGVKLLRDPAQNKGLAYFSVDRTLNNLRGLLPAAIRTPDEQVANVMRNPTRSNQNLTELLPLLGTPTVACERYSLIFGRPRGLWISLNNLGKVTAVLENHEYDKWIKVVVITDGERVLSLGDLGAHGMGVLVSKATLLTALGGIPPKQILPICIDVGTNNQTLLDDPAYIGLRARRAPAPQYDKLMEELMESIAKKWNKTCAVMFADFTCENAWKQLNMYRRSYSAFNGDIYCSAAVVVGALINAVKSTTGGKLAQNRFLFFGAGQAAQGTAELLIMALTSEGLNYGKAVALIYLVDSSGLVISQTRTTTKKCLYAKPRLPPTKDLSAIIDLVRPTVLIGLSGQSGAFTQQILNKMAQLNEKSIIFALSNPTSKAECTADQAFRYTDGRVIFGSGSPFDPVVLNLNRKPEEQAKTITTSQVNTFYIYPALCLALTIGEVQFFPTLHTFMVSAVTLAEQVTQQELDSGLLLPPISRIRESIRRVATRLLEWFYSKQLANHRPEPVDKYLFVKTKQYDPSYDFEMDALTSAFQCD